MDDDSNIHTSSEKNDSNDNGSDNGSGKDIVMTNSNNKTKSKNSKSVKRKKSVKKTNKKEASVETHIIKKPSTIVKLDKIHAFTLPPDYDPPNEEIKSDILSYGLKIAREKKNYKSAIAKKSTATFYPLPGCTNLGVRYFISNRLSSSGLTIKCYYIIGITAEDVINPPRFPVRYMCKANGEDHEFNAEKLLASLPYNKQIPRDSLYIRNKEQILRCNSRFGPIVAVYSIMREVAVGLRLECKWLTDLIKTGKMYIPSFNLLKELLPFSPDDTEKKIYWTCTEVIYCLKCIIEFFRLNKDRLTDADGNVLGWSEIRNIKLECELTTPDVTEHIAKVFERDTGAGKRRCVFLLLFCLFVCLFRREFFLSFLQMFLLLLLFL